MHSQEVTSRETCDSGECKLSVEFKMDLMRRRLKSRQQVAMAVVQYEGLCSEVICGHSQAKLGQTMI